VEVLSSLALKFTYLINRLIACLLTYLSNNYFLLIYYINNVRSFFTNNGRLPVIFSSYRAVKVTSEIISDTEEAEQLSLNPYLSNFLHKSTKIGRWERTQGGKG